MEDGRKMRQGNLMPGVEQVVGGASRSVSKGAGSVVADCCEMY